MKPWCTAAPLINLLVSSRGQTFKFTGSLVLGSFPDWLREDRSYQRLSEFDQRVLANATAAFIAYYEADALGQPDLGWKGAEPKSIQQTAYEAIVLANLALWLSRPSPATFFALFHAPIIGGVPVVQSMERHEPLLCHPDDVSTSLSSEDTQFAAKLHAALTSLPRVGALWTAVRAAWAALHMNLEEVRYLLLWITLEALFGPDDAREITFRMSQRIAFFLADDPTEAARLFVSTRKSYAFRSKVAHGRWRDYPETTRLMAEVESLVRRALTRSLQRPELTEVLGGSNREAYLDDLAFSRRWE
jgi:hypothetical protein